MIIGCKECSSPDCRGCNVYDLYQALHEGVFRPVMNRNNRVNIDLLGKVVKSYKDPIKATEHDWILRLQQLSDYCYETENCLACVYSGFCHMCRQKYWPEKIPEGWNKSDISTIVRRIMHEETEA